MVPEIDTYNVDSSKWQFTQRLNASLAVQLAHSWMGWRHNVPQSNFQSEQPCEIPVCPSDRPKNGTELTSYRVQYLPKFQLMD